MYFKRSFNNISGSRGPLFSQINFDQTYFCRFLAGRFMSEGFLSRRFKSQNCCEFVGTRRCHLFVITKTASTRSSGENFELISYLQLVNAMWKYVDSGNLTWIKWCDLSPRFFCIDATLLCKFESDEM